MPTITAKKSLGQHFLNSPHALAEIVSAADIKKGEVVLEIGPGTGVLTAALIQAGAHVIAIEKDARAVAVLKGRFSNEIGSGKLILIEGDVLDESIIQRLEQEGALTEKRFSLVANIPYYITGAILQRFLEGQPRPDRMVLLVQREVAERIVARDGKESILSISVKAFGVPKIVARVPRGAFTPPPTVDSAIISIRAVSADAFNDSADDIRHFFTIVRAGFSHKRKFARRNLESAAALADIAAVWTALGLDEKARAEDISFQTWIEISKSLKIS